MTSYEIVIFSLFVVFGLFFYVFGCMRMFFYVYDDSPNSRLLRALSLILVLLSWIGVIIFWGTFYKVLLQLG